MFVEIRNNVDEMNLEDFAGGDLVYCDNTAFMVLSDEIYNSVTREKFNVVSLDTGEPVYLNPLQKVICPSEYTLIIEL